jgi:NAD(P)-dependent dehydrogenase (short-subunit alcohol dehydrogenase family)
LTGRFAGKVAVVTGGASGVGLRTAERLLEEGSTVAVLDTRISGSATLRSAYPDRLMPIELDVSCEPDVDDAVAGVVDRWGRLDIAVNAAGIGGGVVAVHDMELEHWRRLSRVNLDGTFLVLKHAARAMAMSGGGVIVNVTSVNAVQPAKGMAAYCVGKAGVAMLTQVAALDLAQHRIRVVAVGPGLTATPLTAPSFTSDPTILAQYTAGMLLGRIGEPDDIASAICFLASDEAAFITGVTLYVDGGNLLRALPERPPTPPPV